MEEVEIVVGLVDGPVATELPALPSDNVRYIAGRLASYVPEYAAYGE